VPGRRKRRGEIESSTRETAVVGVSLREEITRSGGESGLDKVSTTIDIDSIKILALLGEGSFARVYLVNKTEKFDV